MPAICEYCLITIPSSVEVREDGVWLLKNCPKHGASEHLVEPNVPFYLMAIQKDQSEAHQRLFARLFATTGIDVTRRCNVQCPHCYVEPDNRVTDTSREELVELAKHAKRADSIILMGAEPTMRNDLPDLIREIKATTEKTVGIYTNAIRLVDGDYVERLRDAGLDYACISLHTPGYLPDPRHFEMKVRGMTSLVKAGIKIHHVSFSLRSIDELDGVLADGLALRDIAGHIRIRSPQKVGVCDDEPMHLSELYNAVVGMLTDAGHIIEIMPSDNTPYHVNLRVDGVQLFRLIRWPTLATADLDALDCPPYALFDRESGEVNLVLSFLMQEARRKTTGARVVMTRR